MRPWHRTKLFDLFWHTLQVRISFLEGAYICNAYLYGDLDIPMYMTQPTDSSGIEKAPGLLCLLKKATYGLKQAGEIWGSLLYLTLIALGFVVSSFDKRVYFL